MFRYNGFRYNGFRYNGFRDAGNLVTRAQQPYLAIREQVAMDGIAGFAARFGELFAWLSSHGVAPAGPPFFRYNVMDMGGQLDMEVGVPVATATEGNGVVVAGVVPAGRYAAATHVGHPQELMMATKELLGLGVGAGPEMGHVSRGWR